MESYCDKRYKITLKNVKHRKVIKTKYENGRKTITKLGDKGDNNIQVKRKITKRSINEVAEETIFRDSENLRYRDWS